MLTKDRVNLSKDSVIGNRLTKEAVKIHDPKENRPECVPIAKETISFVRSSQRINLQRVEEEKEQRETEELKRKKEKEERAKLEKEDKQQLRKRRL